jgi:putative DNA primase/helicase
MRAVALEIMGDKLNVAQSSQDELRFGTNGSLSVDLIKGTFFANDPAVNAGGGVIDFVMRYKHLDKVAAKVWLQDRGHMPKPSPRVRVVATYDYHDETGSPLFQVRRMEPKNFIQAAADGRGGWATGKGCMGGVQRVPYRLPAVIAAVAAGNIVFIAEGEKGANALESIGLVGTCSSGGAGNGGPNTTGHLPAPT